MQQEEAQKHALQAEQDAAHSRFLELQRKAHEDTERCCSMCWCSSNCDSIVALQDPSMSIIMQGLQGPVYEICKRSSKSRAVCFDAYIIMYVLPWMRLPILSFHHAVCYLGSEKTPAGRKRSKTKYWARMALAPNSPSSSDEVSLCLDQGSPINSWLS